MWTNKLRRALNSVGGEVGMGIEPAMGYVSPVEESPLDVEEPGEVMEVREAGTPPLRYVPLRLGTG
jgi:hypothetical protein